MWKRYKWLEKSFFTFPFDLQVAKQFIIFSLQYFMDLITSISNKFIYTNVNESMYIFVYNKKLLLDHNQVSIILGTY